MSTKASVVGKQGEEIAVNFLKKQGYKILFRNWRTPRWGEVDVVAIDKSDLVFAEVKTRTTLYSGEPLEAVNFYKLRTLKRAALFFKEQYPKTPAALRIDVVSVLLAKNPPIVEHFRSVYDDTLN